MRAYTTPYFAEVYGQGSYNTCNYNKTNCSTATGGNGSSSGSGGLVDTGMAVAVIITVACVLVLVALLVRFWRRPAKKPEHNLGDSTDSK